jgi:vacuolar-type H+-ATPase subunit C/Vma6
MLRLRLRRRLRDRYLETKRRKKFRNELDRKFLKHTIESQYCAWQNKQR